MASSMNVDQAQQAIFILAKAHGLTVVASAPPPQQAHTGYPTITDKRSGTDPVSDDANLRTAKAWLRASEIRRRTLGNHLAADPAWDIILSLYVDYRTCRATSVTGACAPAGVPPTTALRWVRVLEAEGWIIRQDDHLDKRRFFLVLSSSKIATVEKALAAAIDSDTRLGLQRMSLI